MAKKDKSKKSEENKVDSKKNKRVSRNNARMFLVVAVFVLMIALLYLIFVNSDSLFSLKIGSDEKSSEEQSQLYPEGECQEDSDCVKVQTTCCSCNMGGEEVCVPEEEADEYKVDESECSEDLMCTAQYNCVEEPCSCEEGNCSF